MKFTHLDNAGDAYMVDVTEKTPTVRASTAQGEVACSPEVLQDLREGTVTKGDVLAVALIAGIAAAKKVPELMKMQHTIGVHWDKVDVQILEDHVFIEATVRTADRTGVEMEALTAVNVAALAIIDMVKCVDRSAFIRRCGIVENSEGRSGDWSRELPQ